MVFLIPLVEPAQMVFVLAFKCFWIQVVPCGYQRQRSGVCLCLRLLKIRKLDTESRAWSTQAYVSLEVGRHSSTCQYRRRNVEREASSSHGKVGDGDVLESFRLDLSVFEALEEWWVVLFGEDHTQFCRRPLCVREVKPFKGS